MNRRLRYVTEWALDAPIEQVWDALVDVEAWPQWWPHVRHVRTLHPGAANGLGSVRRLRWSSLLPYGFSLDVTTTEVRAPFRLEGRATGDMAGTGTWTLARDGAGTRVRYVWTLELHTRWMRLAAPFMAPVFRWNHEGVMRSGGQGLARHLAIPPARTALAR
jgi:carbon monoxide dehydrogenase subunit G